MKEEEAVAQIHYLVSEGLLGDAEAFLRKMYFDFENRTCGNCKWYDGSHKCNNENSISSGSDNRVYDYDGCKEDFERS